MKKLFVFAGLCSAQPRSMPASGRHESAVAHPNVGVSNRVFATSVGCCRSATGPFPLSGSSNWSRSHSTRPSRDLPPPEGIHRLIPI